MSEELLKMGIKKKLMEEKGLSEEEADAYANMVMKKNDASEKEQYIDSTMGVLARSSEIMQSMPPEARSAITPVLSQNLMSLSPESDTVMEDMKKIAIELKMVDMILGGNKKEDESDVKKEIEELKKELLAKKEKEKEEKYVEEISSLRRELMMIREELNDKDEPNIKEPKDPAVELMEKIEEAEGYKKKVRAALGIKDEPQVEKQPKLDEIIEMLKEQGYEVKGPPSITDLQELQRKWQSEVERAKQEEREKVNKEVEREIQKERIKATKEVVNTVIKQIVGLFAQPQGQAPASQPAQSRDPNALRTMIKKAKELKRGVGA